MSAGGQHSCAVTTAGGVKCWGWKGQGQLGDGTFGYGSSVAVDVLDLTNGAVAVSAGSRHTCALTVAGGVKCWGQNNANQLGDGTQIYRPAPVDVSGLDSGVSAVSAGGQHTCALTIAGGVKCWGWNWNGQLGSLCGHGCGVVDVAGLTSGVAVVSAGSDHTCAVTTAGGVKCWGANFNGALGDGTTISSTSPVDVVGLSSGVVSVSAGLDYTCAVTTEGSAKCWGFNAIGQLGDGTTISSSVPVEVSGLSSGVQVVGAGWRHACALTEANGVKCWGQNYEGQLGDGTNIDRLVPVDVTGLSSDVQAVSAGGYHTCALMIGGGVKCWGYNYWGQLGNGMTTNSNAPASVLGLTGDALLDTDGDGCADKAEIQTLPGSEISGGHRDPFNSYDFYDTDGNKVIDLFVDIFNVAYAFGDDVDGVGPGEPDGYDPNLDRSAPYAGEDVWDMHAPDGMIDLYTDIFGVAFQFGHDCT